MSSIGNIVINYKFVDCNELSSLSSCCTTVAGNTRLSYPHRLILLQKIICQSVVSTLEAEALIRFHLITYEEEIVEQTYSLNFSKALFYCPWFLGQQIAVQIEEVIEAHLSKT